MKLTLAALAPLLPYVTAQASGSGGTTRYWDCCKPSCAWAGKASLKQGPVGTCDRSDNGLNDGGATRSGCDSGGSAYMCSDQAPWAIDDDLAYGWAAVRVSGQTESQHCCACYQLDIQDGPAAGKRMIVQATNTGSDLNQNHFDLAVSLFFIFFIVFGFFCFGHEIV